MSRSFPFIQRRGFSHYFRIAVPADLQTLVGSREVTKALGTSDKLVAAPVALEYAARVKRAYYDVRKAMQSMDEEKLRALMIAAKVKLRLDNRLDEQAAELAEQKRQHTAEIGRVRLQAENLYDPEWHAQGRCMCPP